MATVEHKIYPEHLPPADDPEVVELAERFVADARRAQRPHWGLASALGVAVVFVLAWGHLNAALEFEMEWILMAATTVAFGAGLGFIARRLGDLFETRWALAVSVIAFLMSVAGDIYGQMLLAHDLGLAFDTSTYLAQSQPIDWFVRALATVSAFGMARPRLNAQQLLMEARIAIHVEDLEAEAAEERMSEET